MGSYPTTYTSKQYSVDGTILLIGTLATNGGNESVRFENDGKNERLKIQTHTHTRIKP